MIELRSFAKVNLGLEVVARRSSGFHNLRTVFQTIDLHDTLTVSENETGEIRLTGNRPEIDWGQTNTITRAFAAFYGHYGVSQGFDVVVRKEIPAGSGLGGGSGNAAVILLFLNEYFGIDAGLEELISLARIVGADVPFFLVGGTALGEGIGDELSPVAEMGEKLLALVCPSLPVSTPLIFSSLRLTSGPIKSKIGIFLKSGDVRALRNDLEAVTFRLFPELMKIKEKMAAFGCDLVLMSGSGSAVYCIPGKADLAGLRREFPDLIVTRTIRRENYLKNIGAWPSGKASVFGADIRRFESSRPRDYSQ